MWTFRPRVDVIKRFWRKLGKSRFPLKPKQKEYAILKAMNSFRVGLVLFKNSMFSYFSAGSYIRTIFFQFLSIWEI